MSLSKEDKKTLTQIGSMLNALDGQCRCKDYDEDCFDIEDYVACYEYDKKRGHCPFLNGTTLIAKQDSKIS